MASGIVIGCILFASDQLISAEQLFIGSSADFIWKQIEMKYEVFCFPSQWITKGCNCEFKNTFNSMLLSHSVYVFTTFVEPLAGLNLSMFQVYLYNFCIFWLNFD